MNKLRTKRGETLAETLVTILFIAISAGILVTMTAAALRVNTMANQAAKELYEDISIAELGKGTAVGVATIFEGGREITLPILRSGEFGALTSYRGVG